MNTSRFRKLLVGVCDKLDLLPHEYPDVDVSCCRGQISVQLTVTEPDDRYPGDELVVLDPARRADAPAYRFFRGHGGEVLGSFIRAVRAATPGGVRVQIKARYARLGVSLTRRCVVQS